MYSLSCLYIVCLIRIFPRQFYRSVLLIVKVVVVANVADWLLSVGQGAVNSVVIYEHLAWISDYSVYCRSFVYTLLLYILLISWNVVTNKVEKKIDHEIVHTCVLSRYTSINSTCTHSLGQ